MRACVVDTPYRRLITIDDIQRACLNVAAYQVYGSNKYIALSDERGLPLLNITELIATDEHKVPIYKQAMDLQMDRVPKTVTQTQKVIRLVPTDRIIGNKFSYYIGRLI